jgi:hypothetical protein
VVAAAVVEVLWRQSRAIGAAASGKAAERSIVDPEALILASLCYRESEPRLWTVIADWLREGSRLLSVQRLRNLRSAFPGLSAEGLSELARAAIAQAGDARWKPLVSRQPGRVAPKRKSGPAAPRIRSAGPVLDTGPALLLRLRAAFGVGLKADLVGFLMSNQVSTTVASAAKALGYSVPPIFRSLQDLVAAGIARTVARPAAMEYAIDSGPWEKVLGRLFPPFWRPWKETFAYALALRQAVIQWEDRTVSEYAAAVRLRELGEGWSESIVRAGLYVEDLRDRVKAPDSADLSAWSDFNVKLAGEIGSWV